MDDPLVYVFEYFADAQSALVLLRKQIHI